MREKYTFVTFGASFLLLSVIQLVQRREGFGRLGRGMDRVFWLTRRTDHTIAEKSFSKCNAFPNVAMPKYSLASDTNTWACLPA
jgi:hypothetical protein